MASKSSKSTIVFAEIMEARRARARYGRATLTIARWGGLHEGKLATAIMAFEKGKLDAEGLCWAFVRDRVIRHSPTFDWESAALGRILSLVTEAAREPEIPDLPATELAPILIELAAEEREQWRKLNERTARAIRGAMPKFTSLVPQNQLQIALKAQQTFGTSSTVAMATTHFAKSNIVGDPAIGAKLGAMSAARQALVTPASLKSTGLLASTAVNPKLSEQFGIGVKASSAKWLTPLVAALAPHSKLLADLRRNWAGDLAATIAEISPLRQYAAKALGPPSGLLSVRDQIAGIRGLGKGPVWPGLDPRLLESMREQAARWKERFRRALARNWQELSEEEIDRVAELMAEEGLCLAWAPRAEIVRELLGAEGQEVRAQILVMRREQIVADVASVLADIERDDLLPSVEACGKAIATYRDGHIESAQAYASVILTDLVHNFWGAANFGPVKERFVDVDPQQVGMSEFTYVSVGRAWIKAHVKFEEAGEGFNRNLAAHKLGPHFNEANLLAALLLIAGLLPELERGRNREERSIVAEAEAIEA